jgi:hypothetical protein
MSPMPRIAGVGADVSGLRLWAKSGHPMADLRLARFDPLLPLKIVTIDGREGRESGLQLKE